MSHEDPRYTLLNIMEKLLIGPELISKEFPTYFDDRTMKAGEALKLTINCNFTYDLNEDFVTPESGSLLQDLISNLSDPVNPDAVLVCQGQEFPCHRALLSMRSVPFKYMLTLQTLCSFGSP